MRERVPIIVIVGGGFAGLSAAKALRRAPVRLLLIDRTKHHLFQPVRNKMFQAFEQAEAEEDTYADRDLLTFVLSRDPIRGIHGIRVIHGHEAGIYMPSSLIFMGLEMAGVLLLFRSIARWNGSRSSDRSPLADARVRLAAQRPGKES